MKNKLIYSFLLTGLCFLSLSGCSRNSNSPKENIINNSCPGDYSKVGDDYIAIYKGDVLLNGNNALVSSLTEGTELDITLFYDDLRVITTLRDKSGNSLIGTSASVKLVNDVLRK